MKTIKVSEATNLQLDWLVAKCEGVLNPMYGEPQPRVVLYTDKWQKYMRLNPPPQVYYSDQYEPTSNPSQMWPIIEREGINIFKYNKLTDAEPDKWCAHKVVPRPNMEGSTNMCAIAPDGPTSLIAAARCYVVSKVGEEAEVPDEL